MSNGDAKQSAPSQPEQKPGDLSPETKAALEEYYDDFPSELEAPDCEYCYGEGGDPLNDFCLPCPACGRP